MTRSSFIVRFIVLFILQLILTKYCQIGPFIFISILPAMILCMPTSRSTWWVLVVAFLAGLAVDGLADGPLGLNAAALLPVAALQKLLIRIFIDEDIVERHYSFSFRSNGYFKIIGTLAVSVLVFIIIYVILDSAGTRNFGFNFLKVLLSASSGIIFGIPAIEFLSPYQKK